MLARPGRRPSAGRIGVRAASATMLLAVASGCARGGAPSAAGVASTGPARSPSSTASPPEPSTGGTRVPDTTTTFATTPATPSPATTPPGPTAPGPTAPTALPTPAPTTAASAPTATAGLAGPPPGLLVGLATDPAGLGRQLSAALHTVLDPSAPADAVQAAGQRHQLVVRRLAAHQDWQPDALAAVDPDVREIAANDLAAINAPGNAALARPVPPKPTIPAWRIRAPLPTAELLADYREAEAATGIEWVYLAAINLVETRMGRIVGLSGDGAVGPMQFLPSTWAVCCQGDPTVDHDAIVGAARYLVRRGGPTDMRRAILGYNPNDAYLEMIERYAANLRAHPGLLAGYHAWQVFVGTTAGPIRLPVGFESPERTDAAAYLTAHPEDTA